jgi:hypothetical protein
MLVDGVKVEEMFAEFGTTAIWKIKDAVTASLT